MKIVIAPDSFKGSISSTKATKAIKEGLQKYLPNAKLIEVPISDGGEGFLDAILNNVGGEKKQIFIKSAKDNKLSIHYGILKDKETLIIESSMAIGIDKYKENILKRSSYNLGIVIKKILDKGFRKIIVGLGGSGTNDAGIGMLSALGVKFYDQNEISALTENLGKITGIDISSLDKRLKECEILTLSDVTNPITGKNGASKIYAKQKGASSKQIEFLENSMLHFADVVKKEFGWDIKNEEMLGAAGGIAFAFKYFLKSNLRLGINYMINLTNLENHIKNADWVISGEGQYDNQTAYGKAIWGIKKLCNKYNVPIIILTGTSEHILADKEDNVIDISSSGFTKEFSMKNAKKLLTHYSKFISWIIEKENDEM